MPARTLPFAASALAAAAGLGVLAAFSPQASLVIVLVVAVLVLLARGLAALPPLLVLGVVAAIPATGVADPLARGVVLAALGGLALQSAWSARLALRPGAAVLVALAWGGWIASLDAWEGVVGLGIVLVLATVARPIAVSGTALGALGLAAPLVWIAVASADRAGALDTGSFVDALPVAALPGIALPAAIAAAAGARSICVRGGLTLAAALSVAAALAVPETVSLAPLAAGLALVLVAPRRSYFRSPRSRAGMLAVLAAAGSGGWLAGDLGALGSSRDALLVRAGGGVDWTATGLALAVALLAAWRLARVARRSSQLGLPEPLALALTLLAVGGATVAAAACAAGAPGRVGWLVGGLALAGGTVRLARPRAGAGIAAGSGRATVPADDPRDVREAEQKRAGHEQATVPAADAGHELGARAAELAAAEAAPSALEAAAAAATAAEAALAAAALESRLARLEADLAAIDERERALAEREAALVAREVDVAAAASAEAVAAGEAAAALEAEGAPVPAPELQPAPELEPPVVEPGPAAVVPALSVPALERLVAAHADEFPERVEEWRAYLHYLRGFSNVDGRLGSGFDWLISDVFADLLRQHGTDEPA